MTRASPPGKAGTPSSLAKPNAVPVLVKPSAPSRYSSALPVVALRSPLSKSHWPATRVVEPPVVTIPKDQLLVRVVEAESVNRRLTRLLAVVREAFGSYCNSMRLPVLTSFCGVTAAPLKSSFTPEVATVVVPS